jgi:hypothetical protein
VAEVSGGGVAHAVREGIARAASAPAVLAGSLVLTVVFSSLSYGYPFSTGEVVDQYLAVMPLSPFGGTVMHAPPGLTWLVISSFLAGGFFDRYARNRPTRGRGFFGACGAHFPVMLRLGVVEWLVWTALVPGSMDRMVLILAAGLLFLYARVRLVVEDRRSAVGALLAAGRFIRRNPGAAVLFLIYAAAMAATAWMTLHLSMQFNIPEPLLFAANELSIVLLLFLVFASWASAIALFQARLAHASYTAGPPLEWPESPAAEAITNLSPSPIP